MMTLKAISDVGYYVSKSELDLSTGLSTDYSLPIQQDGTTYYTGDGIGDETIGRWNPYNGGINKNRKKDEIVDNRILKNIARGKNDDGELLIQKQNKNRKVGYDITLSAPKSFSILRQMAILNGSKVGERLLADVLRDAHNKANDRAVKYILDQHLITTRRGKGGKIKESIKRVDIATYDHATSRSGDPQDHSHNLFLNVAERHDGTFGTYNNDRMMQNQLTVDFIYQSELMKNLEALGFKCDVLEKGFHIAGIPGELCEAFSKRTKDIENKAKELGIDLEENSALAKKITIETRGKKTALPGKEGLYQSWKEQIDEMGYNVDEVLAVAIKQGNQYNKVLDSVDTDEVEELKTKRRNAILIAVTELQATKSVFSETELRKLSFDKMRGLGSADEIEKSFNRYVKKELITVGYLRDKEKRYNNVCKMDERILSTPELIELERTMLSIAKKGINHTNYFDSDLIEKAIENAKTMTEEQKKSVRHLLNNDFVSILQGDAGTGKSFGFGVVADVVRMSRKELLLVAPSWKSTDVLAQDAKAKTELSEEEKVKEVSMAIQGMVARITNPKHKDFIKLTEKSVIVIDEAGMVGTKTLAPLLIEAWKVGAKVILAGDTKQLKSVEAGGAMSALMDILGNERMKNIQRQKVKWQRDASKKFANKEGDKAIGDYHLAGRIKFQSNEETAMALLAEDFKKDVLNSDADENYGKARLVIANRNNEVEKLNTILRQAYKEAGRIHGEDFKVQSNHKQLEKNIEFNIASGERIIFKEKVFVEQGEEKIQVNNSDMGTIIAVHSGPNEANPSVTIKLDKGVTFTAPWLSLQGHRNEFAPPEELVPTILPAYAITLHASQGTTVDRAFLYNGSGMNSEQAYVGMTRHKLDAKMYVNCSRIDELKRNSEDDQNILTLTDKGAEFQSEVDDELDKVKSVSEKYLSEEEYLAQIQHEAKFTSKKINCVDFIPEDKKEDWIDDEYQHIVEIAEKTDYFELPSDEDYFKKTDITEEEIKDTASVAEIFDTINELTEKHLNTGENEMVFDRAQVGKKEFSGQGRDDKIETQPVQFQKKVISMPTRNQNRGWQKNYDFEAVKKRKENEKKFIKENFNLLEYALANGFEIDGKLKNISSDGYAPKFVLKHKATQMSVAFTETDIGWRFIENYDVGLHFQGAYKDLGIKSNDIYKFAEKYVYPGKPFNKVADAISRNAPKYGCADIPADYQGRIKGQYVSANLDIKSPPKPEKAREQWQKCSLFGEGGRKYLEGRGISRDVLAEFSDDIRIGSSPQRKNCVYFPHRDADKLEIQMVSGKGPREHMLDISGFSNFTVSCQKHLAVLGDTTAPKVIYIAENPIDAMSFLSGINDPNEGNRLVLATDGSMHKVADEQIQKWANKFPDAQFVLLPDNDSAKVNIIRNPENGNVDVKITDAPSDIWTQKILESISKSQSKSEPVIRNPSNQYKDWNDALMGKVSEFKPEAKLKLERTVKQLNKNSHYSVNNAIRAMMKLKLIEEDEIKHEILLAQEDGLLDNEKTNELVNKYENIKTHWQNTIDEFCNRFDCKVSNNYKKLSDAPKIYEYENTRKNYNNLSIGFSDLWNSRGIDYSTQETFMGQFRIEKSGDNEGGVAVPHYNLEGEIIGFERKGYKHDGIRSFSKFNNLGEKSMSLLTDLNPKFDEFGIVEFQDNKPVQHIYVGESHVDLISKWMLDGKPEGVFLCSLYGQTMDKSLDMMAQFTARHPGAEIQMCHDNDGAGIALRKKAEQAILKHNPDSNIVDMVAIKELEFDGKTYTMKDWNEALKVAQQTGMYNDGMKIELSVGRFSGIQPEKNIEKEEKQERYETVTEIDIEGKTKSKLVKKEISVSRGFKM